MERFFSGYCRILDASRMVAVETETNGPTEVDCSYHDCPYAPSCPIGKQITELTQLPKNA